MKRLFWMSLQLFLFVFLLSCSHHPAAVWPHYTQTIVTTVQQNGFDHREIVTDPFILTTFERITDNQLNTIHVYIEGDGNSWKSRYVLSDNPTPKQPLALELANEDTHPNVVYLARPCQYTSHEFDKSCSPKYWSSHRFAPEVIQSFNQALDQIKLSKDTRFCLIGFSGGGGIAALISSTRMDVDCLITLAGDLHPKALSEHHHTTYFKDSLNPIDIAPTLSHVRQHHFSGQHDKVVPPWVAQQFVNAIPHPICAKTHILPDVQHHKGWVEAYQSTIIELNEQKGS